MHLIVGLGNPGKTYEKTRHNAGFIALDFLRKKLNFPRFEEKSRFNVEMSEGEYDGEKMMLVKPLTYMNKSGESVKALMNFYKIAPAHIFVICDDVDLSLGSIRIRKKGSPGTHNGVKSVTEGIGSGNFPRFRIGIAGEIEEKKPLSDYVLERVNPADWDILQEASEQAAESIVLTLKSGLDSAMNRYNN